MDISRLKSMELIGMGSSLLLIVSLFLPWFGLSDVPERAVQDAWACGAGQYSCSGWETYPLFRWLLVAAATAPFFLAYFVATNSSGRYPTGEFTMTVGFAVIVIVAMNGMIVQPGDGITFGISLKWGYFVAMLSGILMAIAGVMRSLESGAVGLRKPPSTY